MCFPFPNMNMSTVKFITLINASAVGTGLLQLVLVFVFKGIYPRRPVFDLK